MRYLDNLEKHIAQRLKSNVKMRLYFFLIMTVGSTLGSMGVIGSMIEVPDIGSPATIFILMCAALLCYLAIWLYIKKLASRG
ncbi:hypothetical protein [Duganella sp. BuS-21]|uniref:hypothetical protein n=1 Tax=Duganella sp. BuS-21 TaxID=2943848 RepID=UPI0035A69075